MSGLLADVEPGAALLLAGLLRRRGLGGFVSRVTLLEAGSGLRAARLLASCLLAGPLVLVRAESLRLPVLGVGRLLARGRGALLGDAELTSAVLRLRLPLTDLLLGGPVLTVGVGVDRLLRRRRVLPVASLPAQAVLLAGAVVLSRGVLADAVQRATQLLVLAVLLVPAVLGPTCLLSRPVAFTGAELPRVTVLSTGGLLARVGVDVLAALLPEVVLPRVPGAVLACCLLLLAALLLGLPVAACAVLGASYWPAPFWVAAMN